MSEDFLGAGREEMKEPKGIALCPVLAITAMEQPA